MNNYAKEVKILLKNSEIESIKLKNKYVGTEHVILAILKDSSLKQLFNNYKVNYNNYLNLIKEENKTNKNKESFVYYTITLKKIIENTILLSKENNESEITIFNLLLSILEDYSCKGVIFLKNLNVDIHSLYKEISKTIVKSNLLITDLGIDLNQNVIDGVVDKVIGRDNEIERIIEILARKNKNNPILLGEAGVGKTAIVEELARRIVNKNVPNFLLNKRIISLNLASVISGTKYRGEFEEKMNKIVRELEDYKDLIVFIDEIHTLVGVGGAEGAIDASNILKPVLARGKIKCIGATTINEYKKSIEKDKALDRRFQKVIINEPNKEDTINILNKIKFDYEKFHKVKIKPEIINYIVNISNKYILDRNEPDKSIDLLDESCAKTSVYNNYKEINNLNIKLNKIIKIKSKLLKLQNYKKAIKYKEKEETLKKEISNLESNKYNTVTKEIINDVIQNKIGHKIIELSELDNTYTNIEKRLKKNIIGQDKCIKSLIEIIKKQKTSEKCISILLEGTKGNGKTLIANEFAKALDREIIKINLSEFNNELSINKILGSPHGYIGYNDNTTFEKIKSKPLSIILLENINEAHTSVLNLLFSIINNCELTLSNGETIKFKNNIFIFTLKNVNINHLGFTNIISNTIEKDNEYTKKIDYIIKLDTLTNNHIKTIINKKINNVNKSEVNNILKDLDYKKNGLSNLEIVASKYDYVET